MPVLDKLACALGRRDEIPNQELARELAVKKDKKGIREIAEHLWDKDVNVANDCIKVLYEIGYIDRTLISPYTRDFIKLLRSRHNRLVWGGMLALGTVARFCPNDIIENLEDIKKAMNGGSVITKDNGVKVLADTASVNDQYNRVIFPYLLKHLSGCRPKDVPQHSEKTLPAVNTSNKADFIKVLEKRMEDLSGTGLARVRKVIQKAAAR